ncbi:unnamed protein product [Adineta steineri]|uniref:TIR domain-containing protein n=1 Tax=Adineta steineri TaxID=433720 RepID=A0A818TGL7_9BILA|nr:unnamed protein product [Adineta steineri]CAF3647863.1 unnamed protein product [Adineta steineri]CAF3679541.1 unnamed protein product [Adineta steineri]
MAHYSEFTQYLTVAIDHVCSPGYREMFEVVAKDPPDSVTMEQRTSLYLYPNVISWYNGDQRQNVIEKIRSANLKWFNNWLTGYNTGQPPYVKWNSTMDQAILHLTNLLFRLDFGDIITSDESYKECRQIADTVKRILTSVIESNPITIDQAAIPYVQILLQILFYFSVDNELAIYLKSLELVNLMNELLRTSNNDNEIHLHAYRILAVILAEEDLKQLQNSDRIAAVFIDFIKNTIDGGISHEGRLHNILRSLKALTQHEQIREELIKQNGSPLFLRCVMEDRDLLKAKLPALEIILALAFNKDFAILLKDNTKFMNYNRTLASSREQTIQRVATALIWKLEKDSDTVVKKIEDEPSIPSGTKTTKKQYDIMISYSHSDKELCHLILESLEKDNFNVWIDSHLMHGATFDAMAKAIENSEFVFVCMSDAYKQSSFCEMEASYAIKRRCRVIPLVMTSNYKADGWLGVLTSPFIYIDFPKLGFDKAYEELKKQIQLIRMNHSTSTVIKQDNLHHNIIPSVNDSSSTIIKQDDLHPNTIPSISDKLKTSSNVDVKKEPRPVVEYPHFIDRWTEQHVKSFLLDKDLDILLPVLEGMDGQLLHQTYSICQANQQAMFLSFKEDIAKSQQETLSLKQYLTFLKEIKVYIPYTIGNQLNSPSAVCNLM